MIVISETIIHTSEPSNFKQSEVDLKASFDPHLSLNSSRTLLVWISGALALLSLAPAMPVILAVFELLVFSGVIVASIRRRPTESSEWSPQKFSAWTRLLVFLSMLFVIGLVSHSGVSTEAGTALLGAALVVKFMEIRTVRDGRIVVILDTLAPFVSFLQIQSPILLGVGVLALAVNHAAATALTEHSNSRSTPTRFALGRIFKVIVLATVSAPLVLAFYMLIPRIDNPLWSGLLHQQSQTGVGSSMDVAQWTSLLNDMSTAFRVRFAGKVPPPSALYFRVHTLWTFDGKVWSQQQSVPGSDHIVRSGAPSGPESFGDPTAPRDQILDYTVSYETPHTSTAPVLNRPIATPPGWLLTSDGSVSQFGGKLSEGTIVHWRSSPPAVGVLSSTERESALQLPPGRNPLAHAWAKAQWAKTPTPDSYASAVLAYFRTNFSYSLTPPPLPNPDNVVDSFLFETKTGFCAHYSSAFVTLMRDAGVPARVVVGYAQGEASPLGDYMRFRQADAHAWSEVWLDGRWKRFDPTAQVTNNMVRSDFTWSIWDKATGVSDMMGAWWSTWITYYDKATREKILNDAKNSFFARVDRITPMPLWALGLAGLAVGFVGWLLLIRRRPPLRTKADGASRVQDALVALVKQKNSSAVVSRSSSWTSLEILLQPYLSDVDRENLKNALSQARLIVYQSPRSNQVHASPGSALAFKSHNFRPRKVPGMLRSSAVFFSPRLWPAERAMLRHAIRVLRRLKIVH